MPAIGKITLDIKDYEAKLAQARKEGERFARSASKNAETASAGMNNFGKSVSKAGGLLGTLGSAAGSSLGSLGSVISSIASGPVVALTAAFGALVSLGVSIWDRMTLSAEEYAAKMDIVAARVNKNRAKLEQQQSEDSGYMARLQELAEKERLSNASKTEAAALIQMLTGRYGDLGISIDKVTGKIVGADAAQEKLLKKMAQQRMDVIQQQSKSAQDKASAQAQAATSAMMPGEQTLNKLGLSFDMLQHAAGRKGSKDIVSGIMKNAPIEDRIKFAKQMQDKSKTKEDIENWQKVIDSLEQALELERQYQNLRESGRATDKEKAASIRMNAQASQKREDFMANEEFNAKYQDLINKGLTEQAERLKLINDLKKQGIKIDETAGSFSEEQIRKNIAALEAQKVKNAKPTTYWGKNEQGELQQFTSKSSDQIKNEELDRKIAAWQQILNDRKAQGMMSQQDIDKVQQQRSQVKKDAFTAAENESLEIQKMINEGRTEEAKALKLINEMKKQGVKLSKEEAAAIIKKRQEVASQTYYKDTIQDLENQIQIQQMINDGMDEEAKRQAIINDLKKRGLAYDEDSVNRIMELNRQLGALKLEKSQKDEKNSLYNRALRMAGRSQEAEEREALDRARKTKGSDLTDDEKQKTLDLLQLSSQLTNLQNGPNFGDLSIKTNDLTSRGGFQGGAVVPDSKRYEQQVIDHNKAILNLVQRIETTVGRFGEF